MERIQKVMLMLAVLVAASPMVARAQSLTHGSITIAGSGNLTFAGDGTLVLSGANTYSGTTIVSGATLTIGGYNQIASTGTLSLSGGGLLTFASGGGLTPAQLGEIEFTGGVDLSGLGNMPGPAAPITFVPAGTTTLSVAPEPGVGAGGIGFCGG